jgi:hypothetical protein
MKTLNYVLSSLIGIATLVLFFYGASGHEVEHFTGLFLGGMALTAAFFLFALLEERNEEIQKLRQIILRQNTSNQMELITRLTGNDQSYSLPLPRLLVRDAENSSGIFWDRIKQQTGLDFKPTPWNDMEAQPHNSNQIVTFLLCSHYRKLSYHNDSYWKNTLILRNDNRGRGFQVNSICYECVKHNNIHTTGLEPGDRLAC